MIALVSDAGMPAICDPGSDMVRLALEADIPIVPLPGANAGLTGLIASGMDTTRFTFVGFLPKTQKHRLPVLESVKAYEGTLIFTKRLTASSRSWAKCSKSWATAGPSSAGN